MNRKFAKALKVTLVGAALVAGGLSGGAAVAQQTYKVGGVLCSSGPFASVGLDELRGAQLAVKAINAAGGVDGRKIEFIAEDDQGRADLSVIRANKLIDQDKVSAMIACFGAGATAYAENLRKAKVPLFGIIGSASITQLNNPYIFRALLGDPTVMVGMADTLKKMGKKRVGIIYQGDTYGKGGATLLASFAKKNGYEMVSDESFPVQANLDLTPQLTRMRSTNPDAVVIWAGAPQTIVALKNMQQLGFKAQIYGGVPLTTKTVLNAAGDAAEGAIAPDAVDQSQPVPEHLAFAVNFRKEFGSDPIGTYSMAGWDSIHIIAAALKGSGGSGEKVMQNGEKITKLKGLMGEYSYTKTNREGLTPESIKWHVVKGGKLEQLKLK